MYDIAELGFAQTVKYTVFTFSQHLRYSKIAIKPLQSALTIFNHFDASSINFTS